MTDVFDRLVGQTRAVAAMRELVRQPVHAYLVSGPPGAAVNEAARLMAVALLCEKGGCGTCENCRSSLANTNANLITPSRSGTSWSVAEVRALDDTARKRPLGPGRQVIVVENVDLMLGASPSASAFLKTLEEPAPRTVFVLTADDLPGELATIRSRCVDVRLAPLSTDDVVTALVADGVSVATAHDAAAASAGSLVRARLLARDGGLRDRLALWRSVPDRVLSLGDVLHVVDDILAAVDGAMEPLAKEQARAWAALEVAAEAQGLRAVPHRDDIEAGYKREQRRFRTQEMLAGLMAMTDVYRARLRDTTADGPADARTDRRAEASAEAIGLVAQAAERLDTNLNESLLLYDLFLRLGGL